MGPRSLRAEHAFDRHGRNVGCNYIPALLGEPDGVGPFPATRVESSPGFHPGHLGHELRIGTAAPDVFCNSISLVPGLFANQIVVDLSVLVSVLVSVLAHGVSMTKSSLILWRRTLRTGRYDKEVRW